MARTPKTRKLLPTDIRQALARITDGFNLSQEEAKDVMLQIMNGQATDAQIGAYITALRMKGETVQEIAGSAEAMRNKALRVVAPGTVVDTCGTGGDGAGTFNISTTTALVVAACGVTVAKHGNRSISSKSGSADVLRSLGVNVEADKAVVEACLDKVGIGFLFAPRHHMAMRYAAGPRQELGVRTVFNLLGPLSNPAEAAHQLIGVYDKKWIAPMAQVLGRLGSRRALVVHGEDGLDEITTTGVTHVAELNDKGEVHTYELTPEQFGLTRVSPEALHGGEASDNAKITWSVLEGEAGPAREITILNAGAALYAAGMADAIQTGIDLAAAAIDNGNARKKLEALITLSNTPPKDVESSHKDQG